MILWMKPYLSILFVVVTLLSVVFLKMEERRLGYLLLKKNKDYQMALEEKRTRRVQLAKLLRPQNVEKMAQKNLTLKKVQSKQIIHLYASEKSTNAL